MSEFEIFVATCCGLALVGTWGYHRIFTLKRLQWKEDVYKMCAIRDEFLMLRIAGKIDNDEVFDLVYDIINFGIAAGRRPRVRWFIKALILSARTTESNKGELREELATNIELAALWMRYVEVLFNDIILKRSAVLRWATRIPALIEIFRKARDKAKVFPNEIEAYKAFKQLESLRAA